MRADEALKASKNGRIWLNSGRDGGRAAYLNPDTALLVWADNKFNIDFVTTISDKWEPVEKCAACKITEEYCSSLLAMPKYQESVSEAIFWHLKGFHCTCKK